jgi:hypothetical protein
VVRFTKKPDHDWRRPNVGNGSEWGGTFGRRLKSIQRQPREGQGDAVRLQVVAQGIDQGPTAGQLIPMLEPEISGDERGPTVDDRRSLLIVEGMRVRPPAEDRWI